MLINVEIDKGEIKMKGECEDTTFASWNLKEEDICNFICDNPDVLFEEDENCILVGKHAADKKGKINDLMAIDGNGNLILIELKRDKTDMESRNEPLEIQAIRYAASLATIKTPDDLVNASFAKFIEKKNDGEESDLSSRELAQKQLNEFLKTNHCEDHFNQKQRILLVASDYDDVTLSACAWLCKNGIDLRILKMTPIEIEGNKVINIETILPTKEESDYFVELVKNEETGRVKKDSHIMRVAKPKMKDLIAWKVVNIGTKLFIKNYPEQTATIVNDKEVEYNGERMSFNKWGCTVTSWVAICIYEWAIPVGGTQTLDELRVAKQRELEEATK